MTKIKCIWFGVGIDVKSTDEAYSSIIELNELLKQKYGSNYIFNSINNPPHINLYDIDIPSENLEDVDQTLKKLAKQYKPLSIELSTIDSFRYGAIYVRCALDHKLQDLEKEVVESLVNFKDGCRTKEYWQSWREYNAQQIYNRDQYGNPHVLDTFTPHITLGFVKVGQKKLQEIVQTCGQKFSKTKLVVKQMDMAIQNLDGKFIERRHYVFS